MILCKIGFSVALALLFFGFSMDEGRYASGNGALPAAGGEAQSVVVDAAGAAINFDPVDQIAMAGDYRMVIRVGVGVADADQLDVTCNFPVTLPNRNTAAVIRFHCYTALLSNGWNCFVSKDGQSLVITSRGTCKSRRPITLCKLTTGGRGKLALTPENTPTIVASDNVKVRRGD